MRSKKIALAACIISTILVSCLFAIATPAFAATKSYSFHSNKLSVSMNLSYYLRGNWERVSNVSEFKYLGNYAFAYNKGKYVYVKVWKKGKAKSLAKIKKYSSLFGGVTSDTSGNLYVVTGKTNTASTATKNTVFISKYTKKGKRIKTVGDKGMSSLAYYYDEGYATKTPFDFGNCDIATNGSLLTVNYARLMYNGHQSNSILTIDMKTMMKVSMGENYNSHSFAQRAVAYQSGFLYASQGDCYSRAFSVSTQSTDTASNSYYDLFHFWVKKDTLTDWNMSTLNNTFANMGGVAVADSTHVALVGISAKSLNSKAKSQNRNLFIQVFNPTKDLSSASAYYTSGTRSGLSGGDGDESVTDLGVKWLSDNSTYYYNNPQVVSLKSGKFVVLYEVYTKNFAKYKGVYFKVLSKTGKTLQSMKKCSSTATLNPGETPIVRGNNIYWTANKHGKSALRVFRLYVAN